MRRQMSRWVIAAAMVASVILPLLPPTKVEAAPIARGEYDGYFLNRHDTEGTYVISTGVHSADAVSFQNYILCKLNRGTWSYPNCSSTGGSVQDSTGAAFIILTMLGYTTGAVGKAAAFNPAVQADWRARINYYDHPSRRWIDWHGSQSYSQNTYWQGNNAGGSNPNDDAWFDDTGSTGFDGAIIFHKPGGGYYVLRKVCANPIGNIAGLDTGPPPDYNVSLTASGSSIGGTGTALDPYTVMANNNYTLSATVANASSSTVLSAPGTLQVLRPPSGICTPSPTCTANQGNFGTNLVFVQAYEPAWPGWYWTTSPMGGGGNITGRMQITPNGPPISSGISFSMVINYWPGNLAGAVRSTTLHYRIVSQRTPSVTGLNSDIHAGGALCKQPTATGFIKGYPGSSSRGEYVVSASAANGINDFKSNGTSPTDSLRVGQNGAYAQVCRPDLAQAAAIYRTGTGYSTWGGSTFDVTGRSGVWYLDAATTRVHGTISNKLTLVAKAVIIDGTGLKLTTAVSPNPRTAPSLGLIASGDISIAAGVTQVDAYLFSNESIITCMEANNSCATPILQINGFVMAKTMTLNRLGPANTNGAQTAELITLIPQIYLNPPKLFDASVDDILLQGQGEKQPLF